mgnify:CR=1 FL=1
MKWESHKGNRRQGIAKFGVAWYNTRTLNLAALMQRSKRMQSKQEQLNNTGLYLRLSKDDERAGESLSIDNQRIILQKYVKDRGWNLVDEYVDDGYSGTNFVEVR